MGRGVAGQNPLGTMVSNFWFFQPQLLCHQPHSMKLKAGVRGWSVVWESRACPPCSPDRMVLAGSQ